VFLQVSFVGSTLSNKVFAKVEHVTQAWRGVGLEIHLPSFSRDKRISLFHLPKDPIAQDSRFEEKTLPISLSFSNFDILLVTF